jgi:hypothetical protein
VSSFFLLLWCTQTSDFGDLSHFFGGQNAMVSSGPGKPWHNESTAAGFADPENMAPLCPKDYEELTWLVNDG